MNHKQIVRFLVVGGLSTLLNYLSFVLLYAVAHMPYTPASIAGYCIGMVVGYFFNRTWSFASQSDRVVKEFGVYFFVYMVSLALNVVVLRLAVEVMHLSPFIGNIIAIGVSTVSNYIGCALFVFKREVTKQGIE